MFVHYVWSGAFSHCSPYGQQSCPTVSSSSPDYVQCEVFMLSFWESSSSSVHCFTDLLGPFFIFLYCVFGMCLIVGEFSVVDRFKRMLSHITLRVGQWIHCLLKIFDVFEVQCYMDRPIECSIRNSHHAFDHRNRSYSLTKFWLLVVFQPRTLGVRCESLSHLSNSRPQYSHNFDTIAFLPPEDGACHPLGPLCRLITGDHSNFH